MQFYPKILPSFTHVIIGKRWVKLGKTFYAPTLLLSLISIINSDNTFLPILLFVYMVLSPSASYQVCYHPCLLSLLSVVLSLSALIASPINCNKVTATQKRKYGVFYYFEKDLLARYSCE